MTMEEARRELELSILEIDKHGEDYYDTQDKCILECAVRAIDEHKEWVPCHDDYPRMDIGGSDNCYVTVIEHDTGNVFVDVGYVYEVVSEDGTRKYEWSDMDDCLFSDWGCEVLAWQPKPDPWTVALGGD